MARDEFDGLKCTIGNCKKVIRAYTGLQELQKLQAHIKRCHGSNWNLNQALEYRAISENLDPKKA